MFGLYGLLANTLQNSSESIVMERFGGILLATTNCSKTAFPKRLGFLSIHCTPMNLINPGKNAESAPSDWSQKD